MEQMLTVICGLALIGLIIWWFFGQRRTDVTQAVVDEGKQRVEIIVDGGYKPGVVELKKDVPAELVFIRKDKSSCFDEVVMPDFGLSAKLPIDQPYTFSINPDKAGEYGYSCGMRMFFGKVVIK